MELGPEAIRAPLGRPLLRVSQQGRLDELLLGQHGVSIGIEEVRTSVQNSLDHVEVPPVEPQSQAVAEP